MNENYFPLGYVWISRFSFTFTFRSTPSAHSKTRELDNNSFTSLHRVVCLEANRRKRDRRGCELIDIKWLTSALLSSARGDVVDAVYFLFVAFTSHTTYSLSSLTRSADAEQFFTIDEAARAEVSNVTRKRRRILKYAGHAGRHWNSMLLMSLLYFHSDRGPPHRVEHFANFPVVNNRQLYTVLACCFCVFRRRPDTISGRKNILRSHNNGTKFIIIIKFFPFKLCWELELWGGRRR